MLVDCELEILLALLEVMASELEDSSTERELYH